jgi:peptidase E
VGQIIAVGGGGFYRHEQLQLEEFLLALRPKAQPKVAFLATASGEPEGYVEAFHAAFGRLGCTTTNVPLLGRTPDLRLLLEQDLIFVGGGNTKSMLALWREWGVDELLAQACERGVVLAGVSAGAICWFEQGVTDSWADSLRVIDCLGFIPGSCCPHYDGEIERRPAYLAQVGSGEAQAGWAICDGAAVHFRDGEMVEAVHWLEGAKVLRVEAEAGSAREEDVPTRRL